MHGLHLGLVLVWPSHVRGPRLGLVPLEMRLCMARVLVQFDSLT